MVLSLVWSCYSLGTSHQSWCFSLSFLDAIEKHHEYPDAMQHTQCNVFIVDPPEQKNSAWDKAHTITNGLAMTYMMVKIYWQYKQHYGALAPQPNNSTIKSSLHKGLQFIMPKAAQQSAQHINFMFDCCKTTLEVLLYKTIAKLVIVCGQYDLVSLIVFKNRTKQSQKRFNVWAGQNHALEAR